MVGTKHETTGTYRFTARSADFFTSRKGERESEHRYDTTLARRKSNPPGTSGRRPGPTVRRDRDAGPHSRLRRASGRTPAWENGARDGHRVSVHGRTRLARRRAGPVSYTHLTLPTKRI